MSVSSVTLFSELLIEGKWVATRNNNNGLFAHVFYGEYARYLAGLVMMGVGKKASPHSFGQRGMPPIFSEALENNTSIATSKNKTFLLETELKSKAAELLLKQGIADADHCLSLLRELFTKLPSVADPKTHRLIFVAH